MKLRIKLLSDKASVPAYQTEGASSFDLCSIEDKPIILMPKASRVFSTGLAVAIPKGYMGLLHVRSGVGFKYDTTLANSIGDLDSDFRGEIKIKLINHSDVGFAVRPGDRIAQLAIVPIARPALVVVDELDDTDRGTGGFGSTGGLS